MPVSVPHQTSTHKSLSLYLWPCLFELPLTMLPNGDYPFPFSFYNYSLMSFKRKGFLSSSFVFLSLDSQIPILIKGYNLTFFLFLYSNCPILVRDTIQDGSWFFVFCGVFFASCHSLAFLYLLNKMFLCIQPHGKWYLETKIWEEKLHL